MILTPQHTYQILTKRPDRMKKYIEDENRKFIEIANKNSTIWPLPNVWLGVTVESPRHKDRIDILRDTPAALRFLSIEPLLEDLGELDLRGIDWVIVGGETGAGARPLRYEWVKDILRQCEAAKVPFFFKKWGKTAYYNGQEMTNARLFDGMIDGVWCRDMP